MYEEITDDFNGKIIKRDNADGSVSFIPLAEDNADYQAYLRWLNGEDEAQSL
jgi:hypothetical protein